ncbi:hypothetical protein NQ317_018333 [Molorchus minor]|uniref:Phospholipid/glycerol acyltransferase domain-containing protein n=1 Tax=Molorchus minor TaxID=1323400 RepID=A0ABQ9J3G8_9CUCU|nr:hypothetical protein NQ317_018333 [Molorchus minor]
MTCYVGLSISGLLRPVKQYWLWLAPAWVIHFIHYGHGGGLVELINFTQPVYVWRDDPDSRQNTIKEIINRATSKLDWPQILIFPEGTCTNRSCLITFKPGAFYPGVPIQPVCIRYPNKLDTVTWTWEGPSALKLLWLTLTQPFSNCELEFLPIYVPNEEEKRDPKLFANNVRAVMAKALGVPVVDYTYDDCKLMTRDQGDEPSVCHMYGRS